jgi:hypothetical protein
MRSPLRSVLSDALASGMPWTNGPTKRRSGGRADNVTNPDVGILRDFLARFISLGGDVAYKFSRNKKGRSSPARRWPIDQVLGAMLLGLVGLTCLDGGLGGLANPEPLNVTLDQISHNAVSGGHQWVTVSGYVQTESLETGGRSPTHVWLIADSTGTNGLLIESRDPIGDAGTMVTITGMLHGSDFIASLFNPGPWVDWAKSKYPSMNVAYTDMNAGDGPAPTALLPIGVVLLLTVPWLLAGTFVGYVVFIGSRPYQSTQVSYPDQGAQVRVSGVTTSDKGKVVRLREAPGYLSFRDRADFAAGTGPIGISCGGLVPMIDIDTTAVVEAEPGSVFPWHGPRPAVRLTHGNMPLVISFDDVRSRDRWLRVLGQSMATANVIR